MRLDKSVVLQLDSLINVTTTKYVVLNKSGSNFFDLVDTTGQLHDMIK